MIKRCINSYHTDESHIDVVANITLVVDICSAAVGLPADYASRLIDIN